MLRRIFVVLLSMVIALLVIGFMLPSSVVVERERSIDQPAEVLFEVMSDLRHFVMWTPWLDSQDPDAFRLEGPPDGVGATLVWREGSEAGTSRMRIVAVDPSERVDLELEFGESEAEGWFRIEPDGLGHRVIWGVSMRFGPLDLVGRYFGLIMPALIGSEYERGLERLDTYLGDTPGQVPEPPDHFDDQLLDRRSG